MDFRRFDATGWAMVAFSILFWFLLIRSIWWLFT